MSEWEKLYANWLEKLAALKAENAKVDFSPEGDAAFDIALVASKQAYYLFCEADTQRNEEALKNVP